MCRLNTPDVATTAGSCKRSTRGLAYVSSLAVTAVQIVSDGGFKLAVHEACSNANAPDTQQQPGLCHDT
jgi:hypothetical protein